MRAQEMSGVRWSNVDIVPVSEDRNHMGSLKVKRSFDRE